VVLVHSDRLSAGLEARNLVIDFSLGFDTLSLKFKKETAKGKNAVRSCSRAYRNVLTLNLTCQMPMFLASIVLMSSYGSRVESESLSKLLWFFHGDVVPKAKITHLTLEWP